jgi:hypothetical protein
MRLILIAIAGAGGVLLLAFSAAAWFGMSRGHPTEYATWLQNVVVRDPGAVVIAALAVLFLLTSWIWIPDKDDPRQAWWWWR